MVDGRKIRVNFLFYFLFAAVLVFIFVPYAYHYFYLFDDYAQLDFVAHHSFIEIFRSPAHGNYRPVAFLFWKTGLILFGIGRPTGFSLFNLLTHSINALLLGRILLRFSGSPYLAWSSAAFFLIYPPINEAIFWMSGGHDVYGMFFLLLALLFSSHLAMGHRELKTLLVYGTAAFASVLVAMLSKETAYVAFPLVGSLALLMNFRGTSRGAWITWALALNLAIVTFFLLRSQIMPISQSAYGDPREFFAKASLAKNFIENFRALFTFGYFGGSPWCAGLCEAGGFLAFALFVFSFFGRRHRLGALGLTISLCLALLVTSFVMIGAGAAASGRLLYMSAMIACIMMGAGAEWLIDLSKQWSRAEKTIRIITRFVLAILISSQLVSVYNFARRFTQSTSIASSVMDQVAPLKNEAYVHVKNLPFMLSGGPYVLKCYALRFYLQLRGEHSPQFRCDEVFLGFNGKTFYEVTEPQSDGFSDYGLGRAGEIPLELKFNFER